MVDQDIEEFTFGEAVDDVHNLGALLEPDEDLELLHRNFQVAIGLFIGNAFHHEYFISKLVAN